MLNGFLSSSSNFVILFTKKNNKKNKLYLFKLSLCSEIQIKTTMRYHLTQFRMAIIKKSTNKKCWRWCGKKGTLLHYWWECKLVQPLRRTACKFLLKLKIELPHDQAIPLLGIYPKKTITQKDTCTRIFIATLLKQPRHGSNLNVHQQRNG